MGSPLPLDGTNPYTGFYQDRQFFVGSPYVPTGARGVFGAAVAGTPGSLNTLTATQTASELVNPLEEEADFFGFTTQVITVTGSPSSGTFVPAYNGVPASSTVTYNSSNSALQAALRSLGGQLAAVTVTGPNGGPWTVTGFPTGVPLQLISIEQIQLNAGGNVIVTSSAEQQGISPF
jgi:hypothetical protein